MKISKIFAGMSAMAIAATMVMSASATTFTADDTWLTDEWSAAFGQDADGNACYIDSRSLTPDTPLDITINIEWTDAAKEASDHFCAFALVYANGWGKLYQNHPEWVTTDLPAKEDLEEVDDETGHHRVDADGNIVKAAIQKDGFMQAYEEDYTTFTATLSAELVNDIIDTSDTADGWDGILIQVGNHGVKIASVEFSQDVKMNTEMPADESSGSESSANSSETSSGAESSSSSSAASSSSKSGTSTTTTTTKTTVTTTSAAAASSTAADNANTSTGATAGIALAGITLAGAALVVSKRK